MALQVASAQLAVMASATIAHTYGAVVTTANGRVFVAAAVYQVASVLDINECTFAADAVPSNWPELYADAEVVD